MNVIILIIGIVNVILSLIMLTNASGWSRFMRIRTSMDNKSFADYYGPVKGTYVTKIFAYVYLGIALVIALFGLLL